MTDIPEDIVERLLIHARDGLMGVPDDSKIVGYREAAGTITTLRQRLAEAVEALEPFSVLSQDYPVSAWLDNDAAELTYPNCPSVGDLRRARDITRRIKT